MTGGFQSGWPMLNDSREASIQDSGAVAWNSSSDQAVSRAAGTPASSAATWFSLESAHWMKYQAASGLSEAWLMPRPQTSTAGTLPAGPAGRGAYFVLSM